MTSPYSSPSPSPSRSRSPSPSPTPSRSPTTFSAPDTWEHPRIPQAGALLVAVNGRRVFGAQVKLLMGELRKRWWSDDNPLRLTLSEGPEPPVPLARELTELDRCLEIPGWLHTPPSPPPSNMTSAASSAASLLALGLEAEESESSGDEDEEDLLGLGSLHQVPGSNATKRAFKLELHSILARFTLVFARFTLVFARSSLICTFSLGIPTLLHAFISTQYPTDLKTLTIDQNVMCFDH